MHVIEATAAPAVSFPRQVVWGRCADALLRLEATTLCGTDLHVIRGDVPSCTPGRVLGHEGVGEVGSLSG